MLILKNLDMFQIVEKHKAYMWLFSHHPAHYPQHPVRLICSTHTLLGLPLGHMDTPPGLSMQMGIPAET